MSAIVRPMTGDDINGVVKIEQAAFLTPWSRETFVTEMDNPMAHYLVLEQERQLVGYAGMWIILDEAHVMNVAVLPNYRGQGLGRKLMICLKQCARQEGANSMTLEVRVHNVSAQKLYTNLGFVASGVRPGYYTDTKEDALIMWCDNLSV